MKIGLNVDENLKTLFDEISSLEYLDIEVDECKLDDIDIIIIDTRKEKLNEYLTKYKQKGILIIALVGEEDIHKMRELFLSGLIDDCIVRKDIFRVEESIAKFLSQGKKYDIFYLSDTFKKGVYKFSEVNYITYSSVNRRVEFHLVNSEIFDVKKSFSEIEERIKNVNNFYKLDRSTIINLNLIQILDFKEEQIIFKNKEYIYTSKIKLKELENNYLKDKKWNFLIF